MSACMNAPGMSTTATVLFSIASMTAVMNTASVDMVGALASSCGIYTRCGHPSAQPLALIFPLRFHFRNMRYPSASHLWVVVSGFASIALRSCNCCSTILIALIPSVLNSLRPQCIGICGVASVASDDCATYISACSSYLWSYVRWFRCHMFHLVDQVPYFAFISSSIVVSAMFSTGAGAVSCCSSF